MKVSGSDVVYNVSKLYQDYAFSVPLDIPTLQELILV
jgi:hypothetical protein